MARIDDDRQAQQRANERLVKEMRKQDQRAQEKSTVDNVFSRLIQQTQGEQQAQARAKAAQAKAAQADDSLSFEKLLMEATAQTSEEQQTAQTQGKGRELHKSLAESLKRGDATEGERGLLQKGADESVQGQAEGTRSADRGEASAQAEGRAGDAHDAGEGLSKKGEDLKQGQAAGRSARGGGALKADQDGGSRQGGSGQGGGGNSQNNNPGGVPAGFRFNPALMAPVPVAQAKPGGNERLRALAQEIAQKIVERVRVGTNAAGAAEFQIDLRSNVLSGLSIKVSGGNGKIRATFSGNNKEILRLLRDQAETLKSALGGRGLTLEELKIEERA